MRAILGAVVLAVAAGPRALAADAAGAAALQADLESFLLEIEAAFPVRIAPDAPVRVTVKGDAYLVEIAPLTVTLDAPGEPSAVLDIARTAMTLVPDPQDPDLVAFEVTAAPAMRFTVGGQPVMTLDFDDFAVSGRWSVSLDHPVAYESSGANIRFATDLTPLAALPPLVDSRFEVSVARMEGVGTMTRQPRDLWSVRNVVRIEGMTGSVPGNDGSGLVVVQGYDTLETASTVSGYPAAAWRDYLAQWLPVLATAAATDETLDRDTLVALVSELPVPFDGVDMTTTATGVFREGVAFERQERRIRIRGAALDVLDFASEDSVTGISFAGSETLEPAFADVVAALLPLRYSDRISITALPLGHALSELADTVDAWIDDPGVAADIFWRSFASRAQTLASSGSLKLEVVWPDAGLEVSGTLAASSSAAFGIAGMIDGAFTGMDALGARLQQSPLPEIAAMWTVMQALGQREEGADGTVIRYRLDIAPEGAVTFNGQDVGPFLRMIGNLFGPDGGLFGDGLGVLDEF